MGLLTRFRQQLPPTSQVEREVLQAGATWWEKQFFSGNPDWEQLFALKKPMHCRSDHSHGAELAWSGRIFSHYGTEEHAVIYRD